MGQKANGSFRPGQDAQIRMDQATLEGQVAKTLGPQKLDARSLDALAKRKRFPFSKLREIIDRNRRLFLVGDASSGKSGVLVRLAIQMLRDASANVLHGDEKRSLSKCRFWSASNSGRITLLSDGCLFAVQSPHKLATKKPLRIF